MRMHATELVQKSDKCQRHSNYSILLTGILHSITSPWTFDKWGIMDIIGLFPMSTYGYKRYILIVTDYLTKWIEAEALERVKEQEVQKFIWKQVICRFGIP